MRLSTRTEYAIDLLVALAKSDRKLSVKEMCTGTDMGPKYAEQIMRQLGAAGLVQSIRGVKGGYLLARSPQKISLGEIIEVADGQIMPDKNGASKAFAYVNKRVRKELSSYVGGVSLDDIARHA